MGLFHAIVALLTLFLASGCDGHSPSTAGEGAPDHTDSGTPARHDTNGPFTLGPVEACPSPLEAVSYQEVGEQMGLMGPEEVLADLTHGGSIAVADLDLDGDLDIVVGFPGEGPRLYLREAGRFIPHTIVELSHVSGLSLLHADDDGRLDLGVAGESSYVILNRVEGWQTQALPIVSSEAAPLKSVSLVPGDLDGDGREDLYVVASGSHDGRDVGGDQVLMSVGDGSFEPHPEPLPAALAEQDGFDAVWLDWDSDGRQDLYVINDVTNTGAGPVGAGNVLYRNVDGYLESVGEQCRCDLQVGGMGVDVTDLNGDGRPDLYIAATLRNILLEQLVDGSFADTTLQRGANAVDGTPGSMGWSGVFLDYDNDGYQDILVTEGGMRYPGSLPEMDRDMPIRLMRHLATEAGFEMVDEAPSLGLDRLGFWRAVVPVDLNEDGVLDLIVSDVAARPLLFLSDGCTAHGWLRVEAEPGSRVDVVAQGRTQTAWVTRHSGYLGARPAAAHFGLGEAQQVLMVQVTRPDGEVLQTTHTFDARRVITVD